MSLLKNSWLNILGLAIPSLVAIPTMAYMARTLERETFGLFTLAIAFIGYSAIFDGGLSRAVIREVSIYREDPAETQKIVGTATRVSIFLGIAVCLLMALLSGSITNLLNVSDTIYKDANLGISVLSLCIPLVLVTASLTSLMEGREDFRSINIIRAIGFSLVFLIPLLLTIYERSFFSLAGGLVIARLLMLGLTYWLYFSTSRVHPIQFNREVLLRLYRFGSWMTVSNVVSPVMEYFDRFLIASIRGSATVIYYTAPAEMTTRLLSVPGAVSRSLFPAISNRIQADSRALVLRALRYQLIVVSAISAFVIVFAQDILRLWLGAEFALESRDVLIWLMVGFFFNGIATIPFTHLQASGNARLTAIIHLTEIVPYLLLLYLMITNFGLVGGAAAWSMRVALDCALMSYFSLRVLNTTHE